MSTSEASELAVLLTSLRELLPHTRIDWREIRGGLAMSFSDGLDALFVTQSGIADVISEDRPSVSAKTLIEEFHHLDSGRQQVLIGLRHYATERKAAVLRSDDGRWHITTMGATGEIDVGAPLTRLLRCCDPAESLRLLIKQSGLIRAPSPKRAKRLISYQNAPEQELAWDNIVDQEPTVSPKALAIDCGVLDRDDIDFHDQEALQDALMPYRDHPGIKVFEKMLEYIGKERFSTDLLDKGAGFIDFSDKLTSFRVHPRGRRMRRLIQSLGIDGAAKSLVSEFESIDRARTRCIKALETLLHRAGYSRHTRYSEDGWVFGRERRELSFDPFDGLTRKIKRKGEVDLLLEWLETANAIRPTPSREELVALLDGPYDKIDDRSLPVASGEDHHEIAAFGSLDIDQLNRQADELINELRSCAENRRPLPDGDQPLWLWRNRLWYRREIDTWANEEWWLERARIRWRIDQNQTAATILLANGDKEPQQLIKRRFQELGYYHDEAFEDDLIWVMKEHLPWDMEIYGGMPEYPKVLGPVPPKLARPKANAIQQVLKRLANDPKDNDNHLDAIVNALEHAQQLDLIAAKEWLSEADLNQLHAVCLEWATQTADYYLLEDGVGLTVASEFGWPDVVDSLEKNPVFLCGVLNDEYGIPDFGRQCLRISLAKPGQFAARLSAHVMQLDTQVVAEGAVPREGNFRKSNMARAMVKNASKQIRKDKMAAAVAWNRCRASGCLQA